MEVGAVVRAIRSLEELSQRDLAVRAGVPRSTVDRIESGRMTPSVATLETLLNAVGCTLAVRKRDEDVVVDDEREQLRDRGGRRYPAHLPLAGKPRYMGDGPDWWGWHSIAWADPRDPAVPEHIYWHPMRGWSATMKARARAACWDDAT